MYRVSYVVLLLIILSWTWTIVGARTIAVERRSRTQRAQVGGVFEEWIAVDNTSWLPKPWVEVRSVSDMSALSVSQGMFLGPRARRAWTMRTICEVRGKFTVGDIVCTTGDPFGLFQRARRFECETTVIVYPRTVNFVTADRLPGVLPGGARQSGRVQFATPMASGVRDYQTADAYSHIHWPSTARTGRLMVKEFELDPFSDVWIALDLQGQVHRGSGPESTEEYAVTIAASLVQHFLLQGRSVGLTGQGLFLPPDRGGKQMPKALELLALARANDPHAFSDALAIESLRFNRHTTLCAITPSTVAHWADICGHMRRRGVHVMSVLIDGASFSTPGYVPDEDPTASMVAHLVAEGIGTHLVKRGDALEGLLAQPQPLPATDGHPRVAIAR